MSRELENEDEAWRAYLNANGVNTDDMGEPIEASASQGVKKDLAVGGEM